MIYMVDKFNKEEHIIVFYKRIEDIVNSIHKTYSLIAIKNNNGYKRGDCICDINTGEIYNVLARDSYNNNLPILKPNNVKLTTEEKRQANAIHTMSDAYKVEEEKKRKEKEKKAAFNKIKFNYEDQYYNGVKLNLIARKDYYDKKAKRYTINNTNQNIWIPNFYLLDDGTIKDNANLNFIFDNKETRNKINIANGYNNK